MPKVSSSRPRSVHLIFVLSPYSTARRVKGAGTRSCISPSELIERLFTSRKNPVQQGFVLTRVHCILFHLMPLHSTREDSSLPLQVPRSFRGLRRYSRDSASSSTSILFDDAAGFTSCYGLACRSLSLRPVLSSMYFICTDFDVRRPPSYGGLGPSRDRTFTV
jgi:hypothetical protein